MTTEMGNKVFKNMTMEEQSPFFFSFLKGEIGVMVVREDVGARGL